MFAHFTLSYVSGRVRLLLSKGHSCYRPRRDGERRRKSVRGCIVDSNLSVLALVIVKKGEQVCLILFKEILYSEVYLITFQSGSMGMKFAYSV